MTRQEQVERIAALCTQIASGASGDGRYQLSLDAARQWAAWIAPQLYDAGLHLSAGSGLPREPSEAVIEAARRAMVKYECAAAKHWVMTKWKLSEGEAQNLIGEGMKDLGGFTGTQETARQMLVAAYSLDAAPETTREG